MVIAFPVVELFAELQVDEGLGAGDARDGPDRAVEQFDQVVVVLADDLDHQVEAAGGHDEVVDRRQLFEGIGDCSGVTADPDADHRLPVEAELHRVGDRDDLHDAGLGELLDALPDRRLAETDGLADLAVRTAAVRLELFDDPLRGVVDRSRTSWCCRHAGQHGSEARSAQGIPL
ncbi:hypothetical protein QP157_03940 [Sphingomonas sp. LR61]